MPAWLPKAHVEMCTFGVLVHVACGLANGTMSTGSEGHMVAGYAIKVQYIDGLDHVVCTVYRYHGEHPSAVRRSGETRTEAIKAAVQTVRDIRKDGNLQYAPSV